MVDQANPEGQTLEDQVPGCLGGQPETLLMGPPRK